jgi:hypothetical protein
MSLDVPRRVSGQMSGPVQLALGEAPTSAVGGSSSGPWGAASSGLGATRATEASVALPAPLRWLLEVVLELRWPAAVEDDLHSAADVWRHLGTGVVEAHRATEPAAGAVVAYNAGPAVDGFAQFWERFSTGPVPRAVSVCVQMERMLRQFTDDVTEVKAYILRQLEMLADEVGLRVSATGIALGVSDTTAKAAAATTRAAVVAALADLSARTATARTAATVRATATDLFNDPTVATLHQFDERRPLDPRQWARPSTLGTASGAPDAQYPRIGPTSLVHGPAPDGGDQVTDHSPPPLTDAAPTSARSRSGDTDLPAATTPPGTAHPTAAAAVAAPRTSLISRAMAGEA